MRITLESNVFHFSMEKKNRQLLEPSIPLMMSSLLWANSESEYKQFSIALRKLVSKDSIPEFDCAHPEWFDEVVEDSPPQIDATVCQFCGYKDTCERSQTNVEVDIIPVGPISNEGVLQGVDPKDILACFGSHDLKGELQRIDPFFGFSKLAKTTRELYLIPLEKLQKRFPDLSKNPTLFAAIGYDLATQQPIWPIDIRLLQFILIPTNKDKIKKKINSQVKKGQKLQLMDVNCLKSIAAERNWISEEKPLESFAAIVRLFLKFVTILKNFDSIQNIAKTPMKPFIDHPFDCNGTGYLHAAIRLIELEPDLFKLYQNYDEMDLNTEDVSLLKQMETEIWELRSSEKIKLEHSEHRRFLPRFPAVLIHPSREIDALSLEMPACRIVDVLVSENSEPSLLVDSLEIDLLSIQGWNDA
jgi:hypothetical protein